MTRFYCSYYWGEGEREDWGGKITRIQGFGSHYEIFIQSRSSILLMLGKSTHSTFKQAAFLNISANIES
jgi:hypothetical protein